MARNDSVENSILQMQESLRQLLSQHQSESWFQQGNIRIAELCNGNKEIVTFAEELLLFLSGYLGCQGGTCYVADQDGKIRLVYGLGTAAGIPAELDVQHSYLAQAVRKKAPLVLKDLTATFFNTQASLLKPENGSVIILPFFYNNQLVGIAELAKPGQFSASELLFLEECSKAISIYLNTLLAKEKLEDLLETLDNKEQELQNRISAINKATLMVEFDPDGIILDANDLFLELTKYRRDEIIGRHHRIFTADDSNYEEEYSDFWKNLKHGKNYKGEYKRIAKDGSIIWLNSSYTPVSDKKGEVYNIIKIGYDISVLKQQQARIEEITYSLKQQVEVLNKAAIVSETDAEGNILYVNDLFCQISEYSREELIGQNHRMLKSGKQPDGLFIGLWKAIKMGRTWQGEILNKSKNGNFYWVESTITPFKNKDGEIEKFVAIRFDITKQKESEALKKQTEALLQAQRELEESNTELEAQAQKLQASEEELRVQQEELMQSNKELDEKRLLLEEKNHSFDLKNKELTAATLQLRKKSEELELSSKYKSEFLANMSHELRTPLNSIILLSQLMSDNLEGNLSGDQVEYVSVINKAGNNLLELINDILDLSKIESGKMDINPEQVQLVKFKKETEGLFNPISREKEIDFSIVIEPGCPEQIFTDRMRIDQVIKNFLSNAFKFTEKGRVKLTIAPGESDMISFSVSDNGIGIPRDKQALIFEAFQQADGSTKRKYGGTGLGLSISREIAYLLGGRISLDSEPGKGSTFSITIPVNYADRKTASEKNEPPQEEPDLKTLDGQENILSGAMATPEDDRNNIGKGDKSILVVEDDENLSRTYLREARASGFKVLVAMNGNDAIDLAEAFLPAGIILDINLPGKNGWKVLKELKDSPQTRQIPVHIVSSEDIERGKGLNAGAVSVSTKPFSREDLQKILHSVMPDSSPEDRKIYLFSDKEEHRAAMLEYLSEGAVNIELLHSDTSIPEQLTGRPLAALILDVSARRFKISALLEELKPAYGGKQIAIIILASGYLSTMEQRKLDAFADFFNIRIVKSYSGVAEELGLFFNYIVHSDKARVRRQLVNSSRIMENRKILVVDDDDQNLFSISKLLESQKAKVIHARNGKQAIEQFLADADIDLILMDVMMPVMDGYEATREIRKLPEGKQIPIITLTAKNQPDEREKCLANGSSDFVTKPLDADQLTGLIKVWLSKNTI